MSISDIFTIIKLFDSRMLPNKSIFLTPFPHQVNPAIIFSITLHSSNPSTALFYFPDFCSYTRVYIYFLNLDL